METESNYICPDCGQGLCVCPCPDCGRPDGCPNHCPALNAHADYLRQEGFDPDRWLPACDGSLFEAVHMACVESVMTGEERGEFLGTNEPPEDPGAGGGTQ